MWTVYLEKGRIYQSNSYFQYEKETETKKPEGYIKRQGVESICPMDKRKGQKMCNVSKRTSRTSRTLLS